MSALLNIRARSPRRPAWARWLAACFVLAIAGCDLPGKPNPADRPVAPGEITDFQVLYRHNCSACHGADGTLGPAPPLNDPIFLTIASKEDLLNVVRDGRRGTPMPAFNRQVGGSLTEKQIDAIVAGMHTHWKSSEKPAAAIPPYAAAEAEPKNSPQGNAEQGAKVYARACADCHGAEGQGEEGVAGAINDRAFLALTSNQALRRIIITGRPDLGMPNFAESDGRASDFQPLTSTDVDHLVALLASWRAPRDVAIAPQTAIPQEITLGGQP